MIAKCIKPNTNIKNDTSERAEYSSLEQKEDVLPHKDYGNPEETDKESVNEDLRSVDVNGRLLSAYPVYPERNNIQKNNGRSKSQGIRIGELSVGRVRTVEEARSYREKCKISSLNLALFPSSCAPPTLAHERIMANVLNLPFVDQVWVDVNYKSYTKEGIEHLFKERLEMIKLVVADKPGFDYCTLSKDTEVGEQRDSKNEKDTYFMVARALIGTGVLSWVVGGDVINNMVFWKERAKANLLQVDRLIICTRGLAKESIEEKLLVVFGSKEELGSFLNRVYYIDTTSDISSTVAREGLCKILQVMSPKMLTYIISKPHVMAQYFNEFRLTPRY